MVDSPRVPDEPPSPQDGVSLTEDALTELRKDSSPGGDPPPEAMRNPTTDAETQALDFLMVPGDLTTMLPLSRPTRPGSVGRVAHYEVLNIIGHGGMGVVVRAFDEELHRQVAIKFMSKRLIASDSARKRFIREARSAAGINHPNVVTIHAVAEHEGVPFLVMEYVDGGTLRERIQGQTPMEPGDVLRIGSQICDGLEAAHRHGIVHRDIKPSNVLLEDYIERVKITDFGLARLLEEQSDLTSLGDVVGTPSYMSPEQVSGEELDGRSDLFSLGCVLYAMITGHSPFRAANALATARCVKDDPHRPIRDFRPDAPDDLVQIVDRLLQKKPEDRFKSAAEVGKLMRERLALLNRSQSDELLAMPAREAPHSAKRRLPLLVAAGAMIALAALAVFLTRKPGDSGAAGPALSSSTGAGSTGAGSNPSSSTPSASTPSASTGAEPKKGTNASPSVVATPREPRTWSVSGTGPADFRTLQRAISAARTGDVIEVLDDGEYEGPFVLADADRRGVRLISPKGATLTADKPGAVLTVATPGVHVRGFRLRPGPETHALYLHWDVAGCLLEDLDLRQPPEAEWANVLIAQKCSATVEQPLVIRKCAFASAKYGIYIGRNDDPDAVEAAHVRIEENLFSGPATHLSLNQSVQGLHFERNRVHGGRSIHFNLSGPRDSSGFRIVNNTFHRTASFVSFSDDRADYSGIACNNLILESTGTFSTRELQARRWEVHHNLWERPDPLAGVPVEMVATIADAGVVSRDPGSAQFLTAARDGPCATMGAGPPFATYVGAVPPGDSP